MFGGSPSFPFFPRPPGGEVEMRLFRTRSAPGLAPFLFSPREDAFPSSAYDRRRRSSSPIKVKGVAFRKDPIFRRRKASCAAETTALFLLQMRGGSAPLPPRRLWRPSLFEVIELPSPVQSGVIARKILSPLRRLEMTFFPFRPGKIRPRRFRDSAVHSLSPRPPAFFRQEIPSPFREGRRKEGGTFHGRKRPSFPSTRGERGSLSL